MANPVNNLPALLFLFLAAAAPATQSAFSLDALNLGSSDPVIRAAATTRLWWADDAAFPALQAAARGDNPEAAIRARTLIQSIEDGITPTTPSDIIEALQEYRTAPPRRRAELLFQICGRVDGIRVILQLRAHETDKADFTARAHRLEAMGQFLAGRPDLAMREARLAYSDAPGDIDGVIDLIHTAAAGGASAQAEELRNIASDDYSRLCKQYPDSAALHDDLHRIVLAIQTGMPDVR